MTEFDLIYRYFQQHDESHHHFNPHIVKSLGDDAAVLQFDNDSHLVTCVDTLVQGRHFSDDWRQVHELAFAIGYKAVAVNISDIAAMGAKPHSILLALALPERLANEAWLSNFAKGLFHACALFGVRLIGGDTTRHERLTLSITANGVMQKNTKPVCRSAAKVGHKVYVSGTLGDAAYVLHHSETELGKRLSHRLHMPTPRMELGQAVAQLDSVGAMIDISDGLVQDLGHICQQSRVGMRIDLAQFPSSVPLQSVDLSERLIYQLTGGDDYELAFTLPAHVRLPNTSTKVTCIGEVIEVNAAVNVGSPLNEANKNVSAIVLSYQNSDLTEHNPYPFSTLPKLDGFQHFD